MNYVTAIYSHVKGYYDGINGATLTGALDVIVVRQPDGSFTSSPFHVRFGKLNVLQANEKLVDVTANSKSVSIQMKLGANGEAFFVKEIPPDHEDYSSLLTDQLSTSPIQTDSPLQMLSRRRQESFLTDDTEYTEESDDDGQGDFGGYPGHSDCLSDSELITNQHVQERMERNSSIVWDWGTLPQHSTAGEVTSSTSRGSIWEYIGSGRRKRKNTHSTTIDIQEGIYLEDLDMEDPTMTSHYFGTRASRRNSLYRTSASGVSEQDSDYMDSEDYFRTDDKLRRLDALSLEAPRYRRNSVTWPATDTVSGISVQTQTRTTRSKRTQTVDAECCHSNHDSVLLSLCGDDIDSFDRYLVTYDQIMCDNPTVSLMDDPHLVVKVGPDYYFWSQAPNEVLIAIAFRELTDEEAVEVERDSSVADDTCEEEVRSSKYIKTVRLTSEEIASLELKDGCNTLTFSVTTSLQGTTKCTCAVYLWDYTDKIIISDIDGTITRSDVFGHILPWVGKDWTHHNIAKLFCALNQNGYRFLYLSSRAIGQASMTKNFLKSIKQNGVGIPEGPMLLSPDSLFRAIKEEIVLRTPHIFKIRCLKDIKRLFGDHSAPFYAGFGNRASDSKSYQAIGIPKHRVYLINHRGEICTENSLVQHSTYAEIFDHYWIYFPSLHQQAVVQDEFVASNFWRPALPALDEGELKL